MVVHHGLQRHLLQPAQTFVRMWGCLLPFVGIHRTLAYGLPLISSPLLVDLHVVCACRTCLGPFVGTQNPTFLLVFVDFN